MLIEANNVLEMKVLREVWLECHEWIQLGMRRDGIEMKLASRADQRVLRWFGYVERMDEYRMARRVLTAEVSGGQVRDRPRLGWMDGVKVALGSRGMIVDETVIHRSMRPCVLSDRPPALSRGRVDDFFIFRLFKFILFFVN